MANKAVSLVARTGRKNAKAIVAVALIVVATAGSILGVDTGIDVEHWWSVLGLALMNGLFVWATPNEESHDE